MMLLVLLLLLFLRLQVVYGTCERVHFTDARLRAHDRAVVAVTHLYVYTYNASEHRLRRHRNS